MHSHTTKYIYNLWITKDLRGNILSLADAKHIP